MNHVSGSSPPRGSIVILAIGPIDLSGDSSVGALADRFVLHFDLDDPRGSDFA
jgi:hypothetical protein